MSDIPSKGKQMLCFQTTAKLLRNTEHTEMAFDGLVMALAAVNGWLSEEGWTEGCQPG